MLKKTKKILSVSALLGILTIFTFTILLWRYSLTFEHVLPETLTSEQQQELNTAQNILTNTVSLQPLPWKTEIAAPQLSVHAQSAIVIDTHNGMILYEKNADALIPPASMTKLVVMYVVFQAIDAGKIHFDDIVPLPPESWAINAPPHSSLMFLAEGQQVTLKELLLGLAVASGNDAAIAVAHYIAGSQKKFIALMNKEIQMLGLQKTHFVDSSGYSENNITTAREFATFARVYLKRYPESLQMFHLVKSMQYPQAHNIPTWRYERDKPIFQKNTNPALGKIEGVTGLKTGFIFESGYNLALSLERDNTQILAITMRGPGSNSKEGNKFRLDDAQNIANFAYEYVRFIPQTTWLPKEDTLTKNCSVIGGEKNNLTAITFNTADLIIPHNAEKLSYRFILPQYMYAPIQVGQKIGTIKIYADDILVQEADLHADRSIQQASYLKKQLDILALNVLKIAKSAKKLFSKNIALK